MIWSTRYECMSRPDMERLQGERLAELVRTVYGKVPFYRRKMDEAGVRPGDIRGLGDLPRLPFTTKAEMRDVYPYGLLATEKRNIVEVHTSSGTTGKPVVDAYTASDIEVWSEVMARALAMGGVTGAAGMNLSGAEAALGGANAGAAATLAGGNAWAQGLSGAGSSIMNALLLSKLMKPNTSGKDLPI